MNKHLLSLLFAAFCLSAAAEVNYQVIPLPQQIVFDKNGQHMVLSEGMTVGYPAGNQQMKRNAEFAAEYLGLSVTADKKGADVNLMLGLKSNNPEDYAISINKKGITIQGASESGVFYGIQTLRKSIMNETGEVRLPYAWVCGSPRFAYRGTELDCARHFFPVSFIKKFIDILALHGINRFHWHLTDDQGWRFEVKAMPELAAKASVRPCTIIGKNVGLSDPDNTLYDDTPETGYYTQEEMREIMWALGAEYSYRNLFFVRVGYFHESQYKGNRQFLSVGAGIKYSIFGIEVSYLVATKQYHPLANTLRFTLNFDFVSANKNEIKQQGRLK